ncbi:MAG: hypothetical protein R2785_03470 [Flavobacteriaceae bacterium]
MSEVKDIKIKTKKSTLDKNVSLKNVNIDNEDFYMISNCDSMRPFFMSIVSDSNHWMFISSNGGLSAGRKDSENALFPYYTDDKITESAEITGSKSIFQIITNDSIKIWEPFSIRQQGTYQITRNLYKNIYGNKVIFEEVNHDLELTFSYQWCSSDKFGFIKKAKLINNSINNLNTSVLDGFQNIMPYGVNSDTQTRVSNLVDAYKRSELDKESGLGIFALSAIIVDKAEPSEALKANIAWSLGLNNVNYLLSSNQLKDFREGKQISTEYDIKGEKGAYFINSDFVLDAKKSKEWIIMANVNQNQSSIINVIESIKNNKNLEKDINQDIELGTQKLIKLIAASDGLQLSANKKRNTRHFANTLFNIMRGGIFDNNYQIEKWDFNNYIAKANRKVFAKSANLIKALPDKFILSQLKEIAYKSPDKNFRRLCLEYMPLKFSRRHGDPSRPWNKFTINTRNEVDGSKILDFEGNWRDIFQNWEALVHSYPEFIESMIHKFLNATTFDGYNPYRITKDGFDWETIEPDNPWSYIGYWGDHQIIYLLKFLEFIEDHYPGKLESYFNNDLFVYANVPYKIKSYKDLLLNSKDTIEFDENLDHEINKKRNVLGADGALLRDQNFFICKVNFIEKVLATILAKVSNFIPEAGIWMNTQRPEWNDANNALVGNGVSMVTLYYLRRFLKFFHEIVTNANFVNSEISEELYTFFESVLNTLEKNQDLLSNSITNKDRKTVLDGLGTAASNYRINIYKNAFSGDKTKIDKNKILQFISITLDFLEHSIEANRRTDNLYHAYNLMTIENNQEISISYLDEMLEGQVAVLSSGYLEAEEALSLLNALKESKLFREDQYSYLLYPNKQLPKFLEKNIIPKKSVVKSKLLKQLLEENNKQIINKDTLGNYHFNGNFNNASSLETALNNLDEVEYGKLVKKDKKLILEIYEEVFNHKAFTGRSGTFFGYEGLGSIYWHMVSKLQLAVQECCLNAINENKSNEVIGKLLEHYYEINEGIGAHKSPKLYGAFPTDPYSHTPLGKGAQQPGMTGQVKEDVLSRIGELGVFVKEGKLTFLPCLLRKEEFLKSQNTFKYVDVNQEEEQLQVNAGEMAFTYCQVPILYKINDQSRIEVTFNDESILSFDDSSLNQDLSNKIFSRSGFIKKIVVTINSSILK